MGKEQFLAVMPYISADLISMIAKKKQVTEDEAIAMLLSDARRVEDMKRRIACLARPDAGKNLTDFVAERLGVK